MKITIKTIKSRDNVELEVEDMDKIRDIKSRVESQLGNGYPKDQQVLVFKGKQLQDDTTVADNKITSDGFLVVTVIKKKTQPLPKPQAEPKIEVKEAPQTSTIQNPFTQGPQQEAPSSQATLATGEKYEEVISQICSMGFEKEQVKAAMRRAFNNPDRAVEYLTLGIPESSEEASPQLQQQPQQQQTQQQQSIPQQQQASQQQASQGPNAQPLNMFQPVGQQGGQGGVGLEQFQGQNTGGLQLPSGNSEQQQQYLNQVLQQNPQMLEQFIDQIAQNNPQMLESLQANQGDLARLLEGGGGGGGVEPSEQSEGQGVVQIELTQEEEGQIDQLAQMGFDRRLCIEAYLSCDKNFELAANYLLEHPF